MALLDRDDQMEHMRNALRLSMKGDGQVVAVTGEAGIGKTSLVRTFLSDLPPDIRVLRGACDDLSVAEPLGALRDLAREAGWSMPEDPGRSTSRLALFSEALVQFVAAPAGTIVVIEDLHWADEATVDLVRYMARRVPDSRLLLIVTARLDDSDAKVLVRRALGDTPPDRMNRIALARLSREAVARLCQSHRNPDAVFEATGGNAFYVTELLGNDGEDPPPSVQDAVLARADRLHLAGRAVLDIVSIFPGRAEIAHVTRLAGENAGAGIEDCLDRGLLESDGSTLSFRHELARQAVLAALRPDARKTLNAGLHRLLAETGTAAPSRLLHHAQEAGDREAVAQLAPGAARAAADLGSWREAAAWFELAIEAIGDAADADLLEDAAWAKYLIGRNDVAADYQFRAVALLERGDDIPRAGDSLRKLSRYRWGACDYIGADEAAQQAVRKLSGHRGPELALALSTVAQLNMLAFRNAKVEAPAREAIEIAEAHGRLDIVSHALNNLAMSHYATDLELTRREMARSLEIALEIGSVDHAARAYTNWAHFEYYSCEFGASRDVVDRALPFGREHELDGYHRYMLGLGARINLREGRWDEVVEPGTAAFGPEEVGEFPASHRSAAAGAGRRDLRRARLDRRRAHRRGHRAVEACGCEHALPGDDSGGVSLACPARGGAHHARADVVPRALPPRAIGRLGEGRRGLGATERTLRSGIGAGLR